MKLTQPSRSVNPYSVGLEPYTLHIMVLTMQRCYTLVNIGPLQAKAKPVGLFIDVALQQVYYVHHAVYTVYLKDLPVKKAPAEARFLDAAYELYVEEGAQALSMRRLGLKLGVTAPALYKHFDNKDALVDAIADRGFELFEQRLAETAPSRSPKRRIFRVLRCYCEFAIDEPQLFEIMFVVPRTQRRRFPTDFAARRSASFNLLRAAVEEAMQQRLLAKDNSLEVTLNLWASAHGLVGLYRAGRFDANPDAFLRLFDRAIRRMLSGLAPK